MFSYLQQIWNSKDLRTKILFTLGMIVLARFLGHITVPGASMDALQAMTSKNELLQMFSLLTGGSMENFSIILMGISPYINASIIIQLLTVIVPKLETLSKEGEQGRRTLNAYTRWLTFPLAFFQSYGMILLLNSQAQTPIVENVTDPTVVLPIMLSITAGSILLVWLGEQITERGIGNGISVLIFAGIVAGIPEMIGRGLFLATEDESKLIPFITMLLVTVLLVAIVVLVNEAQRKIPITYAGRGIRSKSDQSFLPIRINQAGMIPIIFAIALISFPGLMSQFLLGAKSAWLRDVGTYMKDMLIPGSLTYILIYFFLVFGFTYFYVSITFKPEEIAESIQKRGGYVPGIRPGKQTCEYIGDISSKMTFFGASFIGLIAVLPMITQVFFESSGIGSIPLLMTGSGIIIVVGVVLELIRQVNAQFVMHDYQKFY
ncbi:preprotein translocase subunit SecY [Candidatus Peregrinibacteria bacterium CG_4_10_14_0_2_um_filter_38_24]|nr:MAG: preprotein translocase subunit SecY [Candidatus Peregrinibacteria bacterium CG_4_10_14_0_2_um_filter_38_24]PJC38628.1 MAG: preprotein translocase subunit SecY [Candidatus Peregrinibacteria bacterium CG_4_9_14_0_2_um_filter_38_9]